MKRLFIILAAAVMAVGAMGQLYLPEVKIMGDLRPYRYAYVIPASPVTSGPGVAAIIEGVVVSEGTKTVNPSEIISGYLIKLGYNILPSIVPELAEETMIFSYGRAGSRSLGLLSYASKIVIQVTSGKTHELLATIEAEGCGNTEADDINQALYDGLEIFAYSINPKLDLAVRSMSRDFINLDISNQTPNTIKHIALWVSYYEKDSLVHMQKAHISIPEKLYPGKNCIKSIHRDKVARQKDMPVKFDIIGYE